MNISQFFDSDFKDFSNLDNVRSIPSIVDGLKDSQRKAIYGMLKHGQSEIKVAQASGQFSLLTHYAHGENSMGDTIVGLAQNFTGSNNVNMFEPVGQFGSILSSVSSSHRYIFTKPSQHLRTYFKADDDDILEHKYEDNDKTEPKLFFPTIPMWILNGSLGIGTGHSVKILPRNPKSIIKFVQKYISGDKLDPSSKLLLPHYTGWKGDIEQIELGSYQLSGKIEKLNTSTLRITEVPPNMGIDKVKQVLVGLMESGEVKDYDNNSSEDGFDIEIKVTRNVGKKSEKQLIKLFKLTTKVTENVTMWSTDNTLKKYDDVYSALVEFICFKMKMVKDRKDKMVSILEEDLLSANEKKEFIKSWNKLDVQKMDDQEIKDTIIKNTGIRDSSYKKMVMLPVSSLSMSKVNDLGEQIAKMNVELKNLKSKKVKEIYLDDLKRI